MLQVSLPTDGPKWGSGFWRLNTLLLEADAFKAAFTSFYRAGVAKRTADLTFLHGCFNRGEHVDWALYEGVKERLRGLWEARAKPSAYFFQAASARRSAPAFVGLKRPDGTVAEGSAMLAVAEAYYAELFSRRACDPGAEAALLDCVSARLESEEAQSMEADVSLEEVREALLSLRDGRSPGHDGLPKEFYNAFWELIGPDLLEVYRALLERGSLSASMRKGVLALLFKGGDRTDLANWRPLTLLTVDYKVLAKVLVIRLRRVMGALVSRDQTCGVPGRSCAWNLVLLRDVLDWVVERNLPLALVSIDQEKAFDRVQHGFLHGVLRRMGFGPRFIGWVRTLYADVYSCVRVNGFLSGPVEQLGGVRQGCPLSPLLYVLFMEPFAELVRRDPGVDGVRLPGASGEVLKIQQYADDTTMFVSSARSLGRIRALTDLFGAGTGSKVNLAKSSVLYCGCWRDDRSGGGFSVCTGGLKILGVRFFARDSAALNWEARLNLVRTRLGVWTRRQLSLTGRVVVVRSVLLPLLIHLAYVFPVPARTKLALTRLVFRFLWGGRYEYVSREQMYMPVSGGGRGVPRIPLKLDVLHACFASRIFLERAPHGCYYFARFYLAGFFRHLVALSHVVPRSETPSRVTGVVWSRVSGGRAPGAVRDLQWRCALGRLPVREILHRHGCAASPLCPRGCGAPETVSHVFWDCPFVGSSGPWSGSPAEGRAWPRVVTGWGGLPARPGVTAFSDLGCPLGRVGVREVGTLGG
ncbi:hypothetical protein AAFF_G00013210 [Aldrovandia affinis]|uniref:Reverse transcriptase domain-containing protein n=1 Tax=Aldrovandia affinis TaxID=143900 RepID=A0AAD7R2L4_9TELE|nr:hypothetical protein AAFF_G00013210 [Aldrovandia affinis]